MHFLLHYSCTNLENISALISYSSSCSGLGYCQLDGMRTMWKEALAVSKSAKSESYMIVTKYLEDLVVTHSH